jgi:murein DD-endopeptidase MepM/ murein hydrolase activator NlpD
MNWVWPLLSVYPTLPLAGHPGAFAYRRNHDVHTGVDLYAPVGTYVRAVEDGVVRAIVSFTGPPESPWWNATEAIFVEGESGVVVYGEVAPLTSVGERVSVGSVIGTVVQVLKTSPRSEISGHRPSMLHLELYQPGTVEPTWWKLGESKPESLLDPTPYLQGAL